MKLPIHLNIESNTVWTTYKAERDACQTVADLQAFVERWHAIYPFKVSQIVINEDVLQVVKSEIPGDQDLIAANIVIPQSVFLAMRLAEEYQVTLNTAFIQANGGLEKFV